MTNMLMNYMVTFYIYLVTSMAVWDQELGRYISLLITPYSTICCKSFICFYFFYLHVE